VSNIIKDELITLNPDKEEVYNDNFNALKEDLVALDHDFLDVLHAKKDKQILVSHAAFGYWEERYGIEQIAINGLSSSSEPSQKDLTKIIEQEESIIWIILFLNKTALIEYQKLFKIISEPKH